MDILLNQEQLRITPADGGAFDVDAIAATIEGIGASFRDEADPRKFLLFEDAESRDEGLQERRADPSGPLPYVLVIVAQPDEIIVALAAGDDFWPQATAFLQWFGPAYPDSRVTNQNGVDLSEHLAR